MTLVLVVKGLLLEGSTPKTKDKQVPGVFLCVFDCCLCLIPGRKLEIFGVEKKNKEDDEEEGLLTLPETNSKFALKNGWLEYEDVSYWVKRPIFRCFCC